MTRQLEAAWARVTDALRPPPQTPLSTWLEATVRLGSLPPTQRGWERRQLRHIHSNAPSFIEGQHAEHISLGSCAKVVGKDLNL
jgi:hypothetical protein